MARAFFHSVAAQTATLGLLAIGLAAFWLFAVGEERGILANSSRRLEDEQLALRRMALQVDDIQSVHERYKGNLAEITYFRDNFPKARAGRLVKISRFLAETARTHQIRLAGIRYDSGVEPDLALETVAIEMPVTGRYRDIRDFIGAIEGSDMFLVITKMELQDEGNFSGAVRLQLSLATFFERGGS